MGDMNIGELLRDLGLNLVALVILVWPIYFRRYRRWDQVVGYVAFNISLFTVSAALAASGPVNVGVGFGLFAVLSIVRLRSEEASQAEIGYTMVSLVLGLMAGLPGMDFWVKVIFSGLLVITMAAVDHQRVNRAVGYGRMRIELDKVITDERDLTEHLQHLLQRPVLSASVREIDCVRDTMRLDVQFGPATK